MRLFLLFVAFLSLRFELLAQPYRPHYPASAIYQLNDDDLLYQTYTYYLPRDGEDPAKFYARLNDVQRLYAGYAALADMDAADSPTLSALAYLEPYKAPILEALAAWKYPASVVQCVDQLIAWSAAGRPEHKRYCHFQYRHDGGPNPHVAAFVRAKAEQLFTDTTGRSLVPDFTGEITEDYGRIRRVLKVQVGQPMVSTGYDSVIGLSHRVWYGADRRDSLYETYYADGAVAHRSQKPIAGREVFISEEFYPDGQLFRRLSTFEQDSSHEEVYAENGQKLYESFSRPIRNSLHLRRLIEETAWNERGEIAFENGNGIISRYLLRDGKRQLARQTRYQAASLFFPFEELFRLSGTTRQLLDSVAETFIENHWPVTHATERQCISELTATAWARLDSAQQAGLRPVVEVLCSVYDSAKSPYDSVFLPRAGIWRKDTLTALHRRWLRRHYGPIASDSILRMLLLLETDPQLRRALYAEQGKAGGIVLEYKGGWEMAEQQLNLLKRSVTAGEMLQIGRKVLRDLPIFYTRAWDNDTSYARQLSALLAGRDSLVRVWLPALRKIHRKTVKKLSPEDRELLAELQIHYRTTMERYSAEFRQKHYARWRGQAPQYSVFVDTALTLFRLYPNSRLAWELSPPPYRRDVADFSNRFSAALGSDRTVFEQTEALLFKALQPCSGIWYSNLRWYWNGTPQEPYTGLNWLLLE
jgi:hypothetical protein